MLSAAQALSLSPGVDAGGTDGGEGGIRTHEDITALPLFESGAFGQLGHLSSLPVPQAAGER